MKGEKRHATADDDISSLLVLILDTNPIYWSSSNLPFQSIVENIIVFLNAFLLLHRENQVVWIASHNTTSQVLYPTKVSGPFNKDSIMPGLKDLMSSQNTCTDKSCIAAALSRGLCTINRMLKMTDTIQPRVLVIQGTEDSSEQYIPIMNSIFSAQKLAIPVDSCLLQNDSSFLQQAAQLTNGIYFKIKNSDNNNNSDSILQYLMTLYLSDSKMRQVLNLPVQNSVDFRAVCFCHQKTVSIAFVCPVCLSLFCTFSPVCSTCGARSLIKNN